MDHFASESTDTAVGSTREVMVGKHRVTIEPESNLILYRYSGDSTLTEAQRIAAVSAPAFSDGSPVYALCDVRAMGGVPADARRFFIDWLMTCRFAAIVCFGGTVTARTIGSLVTGALRLLRNVDMRMKFFATEHEARQWIAADLQANEFRSRKSR